MSLTIEEIKSKKSNIEAGILKDLRSLESNSDLKISYVEISIDQYSYEEKERSKEKKKKLRPLKGVIDVKIELNIADDPRSVDLQEKIN